MWYNNVMTTANTNKVLPEMYESFGINRTERFARMTELIQKDLCEKGITHTVARGHVETQFGYTSPTSKYRIPVPAT